MTLTAAETTRITDFLATHELVTGVGTVDAPCSIAAINLALTGTLTDEIPACMSPALGKWIIAIQDQMPASIRNSAEWKAALPLAAGTGANREKERLAVLLSHVWRTLELVTPVAEKYGFGGEWQTMLTERTPAAAYAAAYAARAAYAAAYAAARAAARAAAADAAAARAADAAAARAAYAAARAAARAADAARAAARAADAARAAAYAAWEKIDPVRILLDAVVA